MRSPFRTALLALAATTLLAAACKKDKGAPPVADSSPPGAALPLAVSSVSLGRAIGPDKRITTSTDDFTTRDTIYASVATTGSGSGLLTAHWTFEDGQVVEHSEQRVAATGPASTEFHIAKPTAWPAGKYRVVITLDGREVGNQEFRVK